MKKYSFLLTLVIVFSLLVTSVFAQTGNGDNQAGQDAFQDQVLVEPILGRALLDYAIYGVDGELIGGIDGLLLDIVEQQILYIIVDTDDLFGGDRMVPWRAFTMVPDDYTFGEVPLKTTIEDDETVTEEDGLQEPGANTQVGQDAAFDPEAYILVLPVNEDEFDENAPVFDTGLFDDPVVAVDQFDSDWDDETAAYWADQITDFPETGLDEDYVLANLFFVGGGLFDGIDFGVVNLEGEDLGDLEEFVIRSNGSIPYAFIETDAFLDIGDELVVVSMPALTWSLEEEVFYLSVEEGVLEDAPRFDPDVDLDLFTQENWEDDWNAFWTDAGFGVEEPDAIPQTGAEPDDEDQITERTIANIQNERVYGPDGNVIGVVQNVIYGPEEEVAYVLLYDQPSDEYVLVPWSEFSYTDDGTLQFTGDLEQLEDAPGYNRVSQIDVTSPNWDDEIAEHWGVNE